jgi:hypothetical protein
MDDVLALPTGPPVGASLALVRSTESAPIVDHSIRTFLFARLLADHEACFNDAAYDEELLFAATVMHDLGLGEHAPRASGSLGYAPSTSLRSRSATASGSGRKDAQASSRRRRRGDRSGTHGGDRGRGAAAALRAGPACQDRPGHRTGLRLPGALDDRPHREGHELFDSEGRLVRQQAHIREDSTITNLATGLAANVQAEGMNLKDVGRVTWLPGTNQIVFSAGPHPVREAIELGNFQTALAAFCEVLA